MKGTTAITRTERQAKLPTRIGADKVIYPNDAAEKRTVRYNSDGIFGFIQLTPDYSIYKFPCREIWANKSAPEGNVRSRYNVNIIAVRHDNTLQPSPSADCVLSKAATTSSFLSRLRTCSSRAAKPRAEKPPRSRRSGVRRSFRFGHDAERENTMKTYQIVTDATSDLPLELVGTLDVHVIPMHCVIDGMDYLITADNRKLSSHDFYDMLRRGSVSTTTQVNGETFKDEVRPFLKQGLDVLYICFSSGLSSTFNSARIAVEDLKEEFPDRKVIVVDSLSATGGEGLLVYHAVKHMEAGMGLDELAKWIEDNRLNLAHWFTVDDLKFLKRGGRISGTAALVGSMLSVKPILHVDDEGKLIPLDKVRGRRKSLEELVEHMEKSAIDPADQTVFISHGDTPEDAAYIEKLVRERLGVKAVYTGPVGPVVGSHGGPGIICLFFLATER